MTDRISVSGRTVEVINVEEMNRIERIGHGHYRLKPVLAPYDCLVLWEFPYFLMLLVALPVTNLIVLGVFFAEWRASEKDELEQLTKLNQALACHDH